MAINITAAILITGNEVLAGRTQDVNVNYIAKQLDKLGIELLEVRMVPDNEQAIIDAVNALRSCYTYVFTTGGIGATHDDITAATIAKAFKANLIENQDALDILKDYYQKHFNATLHRMAMMPEGASLLPNPLQTVPAFRIENVFCLAGMPSIMQEMFEALIPQLQTAEPFYQRTITCNLAESAISERLERIQQLHNEVKVGSYPFYGELNNGVNLVVRGKNESKVLSATQDIVKMIEDFGAIAKLS